MRHLNKIILSVVALAVVATIVIACTKETENERHSPDVENIESSFKDLNGIHVKVQQDTIFNMREDSYDWLYFESKSDYELAISSYTTASDSLMYSFEKTLSFASMRSSLTTDQREAIEIEDDLLAMLLNPSGIIQVGNYIFKIDVVKDIVLVYNQNSISEKPLVLSVDDDVFDILEGKKDSDAKGCSAKNKVKGEDLGVESMECKVVYQKAGIYFSLQSKIKKDSWGGTLELYLSCGEGTSSYVKNNDNTVYIIPQFNDGGGNHSYHYRPYSGTKKLVNFHFTVGFLANDYYYNYGTGWFDLSIHCGA